MYPILVIPPKNTFCRMYLLETHPFCIPWLPTIGHFESCRKNLPYHAQPHLPSASYCSHHHHNRRWSIILWPQPPPVGIAGHPASPLPSILRPKVGKRGLNCMFAQKAFCRTVFVKKVGIRGLNSWFSHKSVLQNALCEKRRNKG